MEKRCTKCNEIKSLEAFSKDSKRKDGLYPSCKSCRKIMSSKYYVLNKDSVKESHKRYYRNNYVKSSRELKSLEHKKMVKKVSSANWHANNPYYLKLKYKKDLNHKLRMCLRSRLLLAIKNNQKSGSAIRDLGCSIEELKIHLESLFQPGMTWDNWSLHGWHIDHIVPLSRFDLSDPVQFKAACHYSNLQPLWAFDNLSKSDKVL